MSARSDKKNARKNAQAPKNALPKDKNGLMDALAEAFDEDDADRALELSNELVTRFPDDPESLCLHASALNLSGDLDAAIEFCGQALDAHPDSIALIQQAVELLIQSSEDNPEALDEAADLLVRGCRMGEERALAAVKAGATPETDEALARLEEDLSDLYLSGADLSTLLGDPERALEFANKATALFPAEVSALTCRGAALLELCRFEEAKAEFELALQGCGGCDEESWALYNLGLAMDHLGKRDEADKLIERAHQLAPESCPAQIKVAPKDFERAIAAAIEELPSKVKNYLRNVAVIVEDLPSKDDLMQEKPPLSPNSLGLFRGTPGPLQSVSDPWSTFPSAIVLYQRNLERFARTPEELKEEIGVTLLHEVGHFLGLDEEEVAALGLR